jgi:hypothetical protein
MRIERFIYSVLIIGASILALINWRKASLFRVDNEELRLRVDALQAESESTTRLLEINRAHIEKIKSQTSELMTLRNEVTLLRGDSKAAEALAAENDKLRKGLAEVRSVTDVASVQPTGVAGERDNFPREHWTFAGYSSPEDAMISAIWAMREGDRSRYLESLTPQEQERMIEVWVANDGGAAVDEKHRDLTATISGLKILERQNMAPGEIVMSVFLEGQGRMEKIRMNLVGEQWKFGGFIREQKTAAP